MCPIPFKTRLHVVMSFTNIEFKADVCLCIICILWQVMVFLRYSMKLDWQSWLIEYCLLCYSLSWVGLGWTCDSWCLPLSNKQQKPRMKQTTYMVHAPSSLARLLRSSYRHSSEQASVEPNHLVPSCVLYLSRPDCMSCPLQTLNLKLMFAFALFAFYDRWWCSFGIVWSWIDRVGWLSTVCYVIRSRE